METDDFSKTSFHQLPVPVFIKDDEGVFVYVNQEFCEFTGLQEHQILGEKDISVFPEKSAKQFVRDDTDLLNTYRKTKQILRIDKPETIQCKNRSIRVRTVKECFIGGDGKLGGIHGAFFPYEKEWEIQSLWSLMLDNGTDIVYAHDENGKILLLNKAGLEACGLPQESTLPDRLSFFDWIPKGESSVWRREVFRKILRKDFVRDPKRPRRTLHLRLGKDVRRLEVAVEKVSETALSPDPIIVGIAQDTTEKRKLYNQRAELAASQLQERNLRLSLEAFDQAIRDINHFMSHEFKNPLSNGIISLKQLQQNWSDFESVESLAEAVNSATSSIISTLSGGLQQINEFLARVKEKMSVIEPINVTEIVISAKNALVGFQNVYENRHVDFVEAADPCLPNPRGDKFWTQLAFHGVLKNAFIHGFEETDTSLVRVAFFTKLRNIEGKVFLECVFASGGRGFSADALEAWENRNATGIQSTAKLGSGVGLLMSQSFLTRQKIDFQMNLENGLPFGGAVVSVLLPISSSNAEEEVVNLELILERSFKNVQNWGRKFETVSPDYSRLRKVIEDIPNIQIAGATADLARSFFSILFRNLLRGRSQL